MSYDDFLEGTTGQLQFFLMERGKSTTGNKKDLAARALVSFELKEPIVQSSQSIFQRLEGEYFELVRSCNIPDPLKIEDASWSEDIGTWPNVNLCQIFQYILACKDFETEFVGQYKAKKAYSYFKSGHVQEPTNQEPELHCHQANPCENN